ncbi:MAG: metallophosphoesterase [Sulfurimonas sp.]|uniref:UDP-2,3-diacylglucosamine diphosphatase n=1 Tax=Sulfurimonas sp. TaxID=2022749 RepID=UPI0025DFA261|nr:metallophosphoesterase [Sulfurimonas sp.]MCK9492275.1 metallophosphoesterase [Sulfurimonas sp.]
MYHNLVLKEGAFVIADAHYSHTREDFLDFLKAIKLKKLLPTQLILLGDIFDTLFGEVSFTLEINTEAIGILNEISKEIEVIYLEGNHDFNLKKIFPDLKVFGIKNQPVEMIFNKQKVLLSHGDIESPLGYNIYTTIIRNPLVLKILNIINNAFNHIIIKKLDEYLSKKDDCKEFVGLEEFTAKRLLGKYNCDIFIEGHFHQNKSFKLRDFRYINLAAFACNQRYFIVKSSKDVGLLLQESSFVKVQ